MTARKRVEYRVRGRVRLYAGAAAWHFVHLTPRQSREIRVRFAEERRGWGSIPITVRIGKTSWRTSLFPDNKSDAYVFAIKADVRRRESIAAGDMITAIVQI